MDKALMNKALIVELAKVMIVGALQYMRMSGMTEEEIEAAYQSVRKNFLDFTPDKIGIEAQVE